MRDKNEVGKTIFVSYAHKDYHLYKELDKHFSELKTQKLIKVWHDREIHAGTEWEREINMYLDMADIVLLLISPDFISSQYCYGVEMKRALERHECGEAHVIPIIIRPVHWRGAPFSHLQVLPTKAQPVTTWDNRDKAFLDVVEGILKIVNGEPLSGDAQTNDAQGSKPSSLTNLYPQTLDASLSSLPFWLIFVRWFTARAEDRCYRQHLVYEHRVSDIKGLSTHTALGLELEQVFVNLHVNLMPADQVSDHPLHRPESPQEMHSIWYYLSNHTFTTYNLVVLGAPGSGKTTLLKHLTLALAQLKKRSRRQRVRHTFPILLFLRDYARAIVDQPNFSLAQAVQNHMQQKWQTFWPMNWVSHHLEQGHCLILLDGLDEVADSETRQAVVAWVQKQFLAHSGNRFVLTSRPHGYRDNPLNGVAVLDIQKFTPDQVEQFVKKRYLVNEILRSGKNDSGARSRARRGAEDLLRSLRQAPALHALAVNPLLLTIILIVHRPDRPLPEKRVELYAKLCEILLDRRQEANGIAQGLTPAEKRQVLQPLAYFLMQQGTREIDRKEAEAVIAPALALVSPGIQPADFLPPTENISGLFLDRGSGGYGFMHQTFQEYLAATHIKEEGLEQTLVAQVTNGWWHETIRLYCAQADATEVIRSCLAVSPITVEALTLALECGKENLRLLPQVQVQLDSLQEINLEEVEQEQRRVLAEVRLTQRLHGMIYLQKETYIDTSLVTCAEYQLFLDEKYLEGHYHQPDHWTRFSFPKGSSNAPVLGVRRSDAQAFCECELHPLWWNSEILGYTIPEGGEGSWQKSKRPIRKSLSGRQCGWPKRAESRSRT